MTNIPVKLTTLTLTFFIVLFVAFFMYEYNTEKNRLEKQFLLQGKFLLNTYVPLVNRALQFKDDISLISYMQNIIELPNIEHSMIFSNVGVVIAHNKSSEIGKKYEDDISKKIIKTTRTSIHKHKVENFKYGLYEFSHVLLNKNGEKIAVFRIGVSEQELNKNLQNFVEGYSIFSIVFILVMAIAIYFLSDYIISPIHKLSDIIKNIAKGEFPDEIKTRGKDEFYNMVESVRYAINEIKKKQKEQNEQIVSLKEKFQTYLKISGGCFENGAVLTDSENKVIYFNERGKDIMYIKEQEPFSKHIFELNRNVELSELIKRASDTPNIILKEELKSSNCKIKILTIKDEQNNLIGTIITEV